jgi:phage antirepressor YoqD-like protein
MTNLITIANVRGFVDENGTAHLNLEDVSRGLGFTQTKNGVEYIRWETVESHLTSLGFSQQVGKEGFIPENIFYRLAMKAKNETAELFQSKVADEILPSIRKTGTYSISIPRTLPEALRAYASEVEKNNQLQLENADLRKNQTYLDQILRSKGTMTITQIAKDYGLSGPQLNKILHEERVQYKQNRQWLLYQKYSDKGYTRSETIDITRSNGDPDVTLNTRWTQKGRLFIHDLLTKREIIPNVDRDHREAQ